MRSFRWTLPVVALACATSLLGAAGTARADDDEATVSMARERFKEGVTYFDQKQYDRSRAAFLQAYALKKHPAVLLNLAQSELRSGHEVDAATHFAQYLREAKDATDAERQAAEAGLTAAKVVAVETTVSVDRSGAEVFVDGNSVGNSPLPGPIYLASGDHTLEARKDGKTASAEVSGSPGKTADVELKLGPKTPPKPKATPKKEEEPKGEDESSATVSSDAPHGRKPFFKWLTHSPYGLLGMGITGVGLGVGITGALVAKHDYDNANNVAGVINSNAAIDWTPASPVATQGLCNNPSGWLQSSAGYTGGEPIADRAREYQTACSVYQDDKKAGDQMKTMAIVGFAVSGAAAVATVVLYFVDPRAKADDAKRERPQGPSVALSPVLSGSQRGLVLSGSF